MSQPTAPVIHIYYTGGTIGMHRVTPESPWTLDPDFARKLKEEYLHDVPGLPVWDIAIRNPTLDSSDMSPRDWLSIATYISVTEAANPGKYTGYVILHGTDTMAYTASALTFMFENLTKPVIITGSQVPMSVVKDDGSPDNDAFSNVVNSLKTAATYTQPDVCLFFYDKLMLGCRTVKIDTADWDAFDSPNREPLARIVDKEVLYHESVADQPLRAVTGDLKIQEFAPTKVALLRFFPGLSPDIVKSFLFTEHLQGAILHAFGAGNGPGNLEDIFRQATDIGKKVLVACTQCLRGMVNINDYATGLGNCGVISGYDMTVEAAVAKLFWLFSRYSDIEVIKEQMQLNLRGELTRPKE